MTVKHTSILRFLISLAAMMLAISANAQSAFNLTLKLVDAKTSEPVAFATVSLTENGKDSAAKYVLTNSEGKAQFAKVRKGTYVLKAEIMGYKTHVQNVTLDKNQDLGTVKMEEDVKVLAAAKVSAVGNPIVVKKDTIEYNASSFKTSDNDMLEELLNGKAGARLSIDSDAAAKAGSFDLILRDGVHPSVMGHQVLADAWLKYAGHLI